ncbi:TerD family protein [Deinococcus sp. Arct2-2]|uniref:TerD family protein n=1 Tax=Deinococcus sp. Arct2-2 TaxID=2568653 RepID=UPI001454E3D7|nr:TerD family protein [Deinococcus sp. Arct2-2]
MRLHPGQRANLADLGPLPIPVYCDSAALIIAVRVGSTVEELFSIYNSQDVGGGLTGELQCLVNLVDIPAVVDDLTMIAHSPRVLSGTVQIGAVQFDLAELGSGNTCGVFGRFYRYNGQWKYAAMNLGFPALAGLAGLLRVSEARLNPAPAAS